MIHKEKYFSVYGGRIILKNTFTENKTRRMVNCGSCMVAAFISLSAVRKKQPAHAKCLIFLLCVVLNSFEVHAIKVFFQNLRFYLFTPINFYHYLVGNH